ncbi:MAG: Hsp70 family protein [Kofleriaceae bacterium]|nr:Hsp70 family protein [Kofleriaceae bacterium]MBP9166556.1 Hsp70 family protein [Kofleriaceae bacterium]MBP9859698.1 Hsp70 family protein [Kofleriaceae bacterium]
MTTTTNDPIIGIDLGTTNSVAARCDASGAPVVLADDKGGKIHPSVVSFHPNGSVVVGAEAKQRRIIDPRNTVYSAKRLIGRSFRSREIHAAMQRMPYEIKEGANQQPVIVTRGGEFAVPEISAIVLDHVRGVAAKALGREVNRAVVTVPASFNDAQRSATATAGAIAGITVVRVLNEPTAAALAYGHARQLSKLIAVYDFGGGTFDVTLLRLQDQVYEVLATAGDSFLGGDDIDELLMEHMADVCLTKLRTDVRGNDLAVMRLRAVAEQAKIELSRRQRALVKVDEVAYGAGGVPLNLETEITRDQLIAKAAPLIERTFTVCAEALTLAGLSASAVEDVVLVGGTTKIPHVRERVTQFFQRAPRTDIHPEEAVAQGAALQALSLERILNRRSTGRNLTPMAGVPAIPARAPEPRAGEPSRTTAPMAPPPVPTRGEVGDRPASRGAQVDRFEDGGTGTHRLARITSRGTAAVPPPTPPTPPRPTGPRSKTMIGLAPEPVDEDTATFDAPTAQGPGWPTEVPREPEPTAPPRAATADARTLIAEAPTRTTDRGLGAPAPEPSPASTLPMPAGAPLTPSGPGPAPHQAATLFGVPAAAMGPAAPGPAPHQAATMFGAPAGVAPAPMAMPPMPPMPPMPIPTVVEVVPRGLGIGTVAGYCEALIQRNARVPAETKRMFSTSRDQQQTVRIRVVQGESRRVEDNAVLGDLVLENLPPRPRGATAIEVVFAVDASGILRVRARDAQTGQEQQASLDLIGTQSPAEVEAARERFAGMRR